LRLRFFFVFSSSSSASFFSSSGFGFFLFFFRATALCWGLSGNADEASNAFDKGLLSDFFLLSPKRDPNNDMMGMYANSITI
jgi:hypothetical protein